MSRFERTCPGCQGPKIETPLTAAPDETVWRALVILATAVLVAPSAHAQVVHTLTVFAHNAGPPGSHNEDPYWFEIEGYNGTNPDIHFDPGAYRVFFVNMGDRPHSFHVEAPWGAATHLIAPNATAVLEFTVPTTNSSGFYFCDAHHDIGMAGRWSTGNATPTGTPAVAQRRDLIPAPSGLWALGAALVFARRRP